MTPKILYLIDSERQRLAVRIKSPLTGEEFSAARAVVDALEGFALIDIDLLDLSYVDSFEMLLVEALLSHGARGIVRAAGPASEALRLCLSERPGIEIVLLPGPLR